MPGGGCALPGLRNLHHIDIAGWRLRLTRPTKPAPHRYCRVAAAPYPTYKICTASTLPGGGFALPGLQNLHHIDIAGWRLRLTRPTKPAPHRYCRMAAPPYPAYKICTASTLPGGGSALPGLRNLHHIDIAGWRLRLTRPTKPARNCRPGKRMRRPAWQTAPDPTGRENR